MVFPTTMRIKIKPQSPEMTPRVIFMDEMPHESTPITVKRVIT